MDNFLAPEDTLVVHKSPLRATGSRIEKNKLPLSSVSEENYPVLVNNFLFASLLNYYVGMSSSDSILRMGETLATCKK